MLNKKYRLKKRKTFNYIYRNGKSTGADCLTLVYVPCKMREEPFLKIGFSASKKVGNSVKRHRAVRLMREAVRPMLSQIAPHHNLIFVAKDIILTKKLDDIKTAVSQVLKKAGLVCAR